MPTKPTYVYKFRQFDERHLRILTHNELYFPSATKLNDPFDCRIPIRYDIGTKTEVVTYWAARFKELDPTLSDAQCLVKAEDLYNKGEYRTPAGIQAAMRVSTGFAENQIGIYALSELYGNMLLWAHYSNSHSGFAIGFDTKRLSRFRQDFLKRSNEVIALEPVTYSGNYPIINAYRDSNLDRLKKQFLTKSADWAYEREYRMLWKLGVNKALVIDDDIIGRVILDVKLQTLFGR